ncbi:hypothetical protein [Methanochimaera problematica]|uniref:hypothetical protein n=1 Tax=Methanochimaera problematica TaxID=2609417 RepID=UPI002938E5B6|nr:hypothetical protein [Methanoplanus sp. FWC-SCC4]
MKKAIPRIDREILERLPLVEKAFAKYLIQKGELILDFSRNNSFEGGGDNSSSMCINSQ